MRNDTRLRGQGFRLVLISGIVVTIGVIVAAAPASAQAVRQLDLSAGYLNVNGSMHGVNVHMSTGITRGWSLVGEFDGSHGEDPECSVGCGPNYRDEALLGGVRFAWHPTVRISPFLQVLGGGLHSTAGAYYVDYCCGLGRRDQQGYTVNYLALQPGGGVTIMVTPRFGVRAQTDVQWGVTNKFGGGGSIFPRVVAGGVVRLWDRK